ncbi:hypothetical protein CAEBREN_07281 [Caenorhabditis brenneri]|uniref:Uncharacterized protein n=1 Tax=Caenorhabditis brenneri TaxID=135651 RepID=G0MDK7_CAEBE|nr:hypothetical protein CAEBREN_07281 [Caenorhabditis brenneri]
MPGCTYNLKDKAVPATVKFEKAEYEKLDSDGKKALWKDYEAECDKFYKTDAYSDKETYGYVLCCDMFGDCGTSGWVIFLIILLVLGLLAGGAAAFWFFYWKRKNGGKEEMVEENTESTENSKTVIEIPVGTY